MSNQADPRLRRWCSLPSSLHCERPSFILKDDDGRTASHRLVLVHVEGRGLGLVIAIIPGRGSASEDRVRRIGHAALNGRWLNAPGRALEFAFVQGRCDMIPIVVFTIGHSTRSMKEFVRLIKAHGGQRVIDVRTIPRSRRNPQFNRDQLSPALHRARMHYRHLPGLGGLRHARRDSTNTGWRNASFRGYADYMQTTAFGESLNRCIEFATHERVVLMCAEAVPWRCHRSLIADALLVRGIQVQEITSGTRTRPHVLTPWARVRGTQVTYPAPADTFARQAG